jgi:hypothetical protein
MEGTSAEASRTVAVQKADGDGIILLIRSSLPDVACHNHSCPLVGSKAIIVAQALAPLPNTRDAQAASRLVLHSNAADPEQPASACWLIPVGYFSQLDQ